MGNGYVKELDYDFKLYDWESQADNLRMCKLIAETMKHHKYNKMAITAQITCTEFFFGKPISKFHSKYDWINRIVWSFRGYKTGNYILNNLSLPSPRVEDTETIPFLTLYRKMKYDQDKTKNSFTSFKFE